MEVPKESVPEKQKKCNKRTGFLSHMVCLLTFLLACIVPALAGSIRKAAHIIESLLEGFSLFRDRLSLTIGVFLHLHSV
jgi:hypothetical protein